MPPRWWSASFLIGLLVAAPGGCAHAPAAGPGSPPGKPRELGHVSGAERLEYIRRSQLWRPTPIATLDLLAGPPGEGSFPFDERLACDYFHHPDPSGNTPKFYCTVAPGDTVKVKYGRKNGEVYAEVAATRLLWALGFGADRIYPVRVTCRRCPIEPWYWRQERTVEERSYDVATVERKIDGQEIKAEGLEGWAWPELEGVEEAAGGAPRAQVDALKLLAAFIQHSDTKAAQQRLVCLPGGVETDSLGNERCTKPFLMINDVGTAFARADLLNRNKMNLAAWSSVPVWKDAPRCVAYLKKSLTGTLEHPRVSEAGRGFLAGLLLQLSEDQIRDIFRAARVERRRREIREDGRTRAVTADDWLRVFKRKRDEIINRRCPS